MTDPAILTKVCVALFVTTSLLHAGLGLSVAQVRSPLRDPRLVLGALIGNFVLVPTAALLIARLLHLSDGLSLGLLLVAMSAGAPFLPRLVELARGNTALGVAVMTLLLVTTLVYLPLVLPRFAPGVPIEPWAIARPVLLLMLLPLAAGMAVRASPDGTADRERRQVPQRPRQRRRMRQLNRQAPQRHRRRRRQHEGQAISAVLRSQRVP